MSGVDSGFVSQADRVADNDNSYLMSFLDRVNVGTAKLVGLSTQLKLTSLEYSNASMSEWTALDWHRGNADPRSLLRLLRRVRGPVQPRAQEIPPFALDPVHHGLLGHLPDLQ